MANPNIKKDANGNYVIVGFEGKNFTKQQLDYVDIQQQAEVLNGPQGDELRRTISANPNASAGVISGLYKSGSLGSSQLVKTFSDIDEQTKANREKQALLKTQEEANANFKKQLFGVPYNVWKSLKGVTRTTFTAAFGAIYNSTSSNKLVVVLDFGGNKTCTNGTFTVTFPSPTGGSPSGSAAIISITS